MQLRFAAAVAAFALLGASTTYAQQEVARDVYAKVAPSVLLVVALDRDGKVISQGSGFVIDGNLVVTNAHVVREGTAAIVTGVARIQCAITRINNDLDLAVLRPNAVLSVAPLRAAAANTPIGTRIFAIGNPQGLERTITEGIYNGPRQVQGSNLVQVSAPISPGSSGGPIVDSNGLVVAIAVGSLEGQNLNFGVAVDALIGLLGQPEEPRPIAPAPVTPAPSGTLPAGTTHIPEVSRTVAAHLGEYLAAMKERNALGVAPQTRAQWDALRDRERRAIVAALAAARTDDELLGVHGSALEGFHDDVALDAARKALRAATRPAAWHHLGIAWSAMKQAEYLDEPARSEMLKEARGAIQSALPLDGGARTWILSGVINAASRDFAAARNAFDVADKLRVPEDSRADVLRGRWRIAVGEKQEADALRLFADLDRTGLATDHDRYSHGNFLLDVGRYAEAAPIFEALSSKPEQYAWTETYNIVYRAAYARWMLSEREVAMGHASRAIGAARGKTGSTRIVAQAHTIIAHMLMANGDPSLALEASRQATLTDPTYAWGFTQHARAANLLAMPPAAEAAAKKAIEISQGKDADAHFELGMAYFGQKLWTLSQQSFETVVRLDKTHAYAAYNIAQAHVNAGTEREAVAWYEEALRRDPKMKERDQILAAIARIRGR